VAVPVSFWFSLTQSFHLLRQGNLRAGVARSDHRHLARGASTLPKRQKRIRATPSFGEFKAIVETIRSQKFNGHDPEESADFVEFLGLAGLGRAEAAALRQSDIDWNRETITTFRHKTKSGFAIPIYPQVKPLLLRRRRDDAPNERVFAINDAKKAIANACRRLNLPKYSHISFRQMFITRAIERGVDVKVIAEWRGHKDGGKLILDTYSHVNRAHSHRMAQLMTDALPDNVAPYPPAFCNERKEQSRAKRRCGPTASKRLSGEIRQHGTS
jgi:integrase